MELNATRYIVEKLMDELIHEAEENPDWKAVNALRCAKKELLEVPGLIEPPKGDPTMDLQKLFETILQKIDSMSKDELDASMQRAEEDSADSYLIEEEDV